jgi:hypothetical protein
VLATDDGVFERDVDIPQDGTLSAVAKQVHVVLRSVMVE